MFKEERIDFKYGDLTCYVNKDRSINLEIFIKDIYGHKIKSVDLIYILESNNRFKIIKFKNVGDNCFTSKIDENFNAHKYAMEFKVYIDYYKDTVFSLPIKNIKYKCNSENNYIYEHIVPFVNNETKKAINMYKKLKEEGVPNDVIIHYICSLLNATK